MDVLNRIQFLQQFSYKHEGVQLRFLQLLSEAARQTITYSCLNSFAFGSRFTTLQGDDIDSAVGRFKRSTYVDVVDECVSYLPLPQVSTQKKKNKRYKIFAFQIVYFYYYFFLIRSSSYVLVSSNSLSRRLC